MYFQVSQTFLQSLTSNPCKSLQVTEPLTCRDVLLPFCPATCITKLHVTKEQIPPIRTACDLLISSNTLQLVPCDPCDF